jgi:hypothetical protein
LQPKAFTTRFGNWLNVRKYFGVTQCNSGQCLAVISY